VPTESPYPIGGLITDSRLLQNRRSEIQRALDVVAPPEEGSGHALLIGEQHCGRSSALGEIGRRAAAECQRLVISLSGSEDLIHTRQSFCRRVLTGVVEALAQTDPEAEWYQAWRDRVYLRSTNPASGRDVLTSSLILASDPERELDRAIFDRDLKALLGIAEQNGYSGIIVSIDDASPLTEDVSLVEGLLDGFDSVGGYALLMAGLPTTALHFTQAASSCVNRVTPIMLRPFRGPHQLYSALSVPLTESDQDYLRADDIDLMRDILQLTGGNPYEVMVVGHYLWLSCELEEQEHFVLTSRVLDRVIPHLSMLAADGDALRDGAQAIERLPEEQVEKAVEMAAFSSLSVSEIAIARLLKVSGDDEKPLSRAELLTSEIDAESHAVCSELEQLQDAGVIQLHEDGERFNVVGGRPASVLLKYRDRARKGADVARQSFEQGFLFSVGQALARDASLGCLEALGSVNSLGFSEIMSSGSLGRLSPRPGIRSLATGGDLERFIEADVDLVPWNLDAYKRVAEIIAETEPSIALMGTSLMYGGDQLEYMEVWQLSEEVTQEEVDSTFSTVAEGWVPMVEAAGLRWTGNESAVLHGELARKTLIILLQFAATSAVHQLFNEWQETEDSDALARARNVASEAVETLSETGQSDFELGGELSGMLSRLGFLNSFDDELLKDARFALEEALRLGQADGWVTRWNLANIFARQGSQQEALETLDEIAEHLQESAGSVSMLFFVPGRDPADSLLSVTDAGVSPLLELQRAVISDGDDAIRKAAIDHCLDSGDEAAAQAAEWVSNALTAT
jgi:hypothetical protein